MNFCLCRLQDIFTVNFHIIWKNQKLDKCPPRTSAEKAWTRSSLCTSGHRARVTLHNQYSHHIYLCFFRALFWCFSRSQNDLKVQLIICNSGNSWRSRRRPVCVNVGSFCSGKVAICSKSDLKSNLPVTRSPVFTCAINLCPVTSLLLSAVFCLTAVFFVVFNHYHEIFIILLFTPYGIKHVTHRFKGRLWLNKSI